MTEESLRRTPLYDFHLSLGAKIVPFAGYEMPVQYKDGIIAEHKWTREKAGLFDVSHMGLIRISGKDSAKVLESFLPVDCDLLKKGSQKYSYLLNENGGILDDLMITNYGDFYIIVANASRKENDFVMIAESCDKARKNGADIKVEALSDYALLALQGPKAREVMESFNPALKELFFMQATQAKIMDCDCLVSCSGYTGEDGYEIAIPADKARDFVTALLKNPDVAPIGLGARDTLRLEAGLCLYGNDITESVTPAEAGITFAISKRRREEASFPGAAAVLSGINNGTDIRLAGVKVDSKIPVRHGDEVLATESGEKVGEITSGSFSPTLNYPIALALIDDAFAAKGTKLQVKGRRENIPVTVTPLPFVPHHYHKP